MQHVRNIDLGLRLHAVHLRHDIEVLLDCEVGEHAAPFGEQAQPTIEPVRDGERVDPIAIEPDLAGDRLEQTEDRLEGRGLAGAVVTEERHDLAGLQRKRDVGDDDLVAVPGGKIAHL